MTVSSCPLPTLPVWAAARVVVGVPPEGERWTYCIYLFFTTNLYYLIRCPDWKVPDELWRSGCITISSSPLPILPRWAMACRIVDSFQGFFCGHWGKYFKNIYVCFYFFIISLGTQSFT